jgi:hypothetical protein
MPSSIVWTARRRRSADRLGAIDASADRNGGSDEQADVRVHGHRRNGARLRGVLGPVAPSRGRRGACDRRNQRSAVARRITFVFGSRDACRDPGHAVGRDCERTVTIRRVLRASSRGRRAPGAHVGRDHLHDRRNGHADDRRPPVSKPVRRCGQGMLARRRAVAEVSSVDAGDAVGQDRICTPLPLIGERGQRRGPLVARGERSASVSSHPRTRRRNRRRTSRSPRYVIVAGMCSQ